MEDFNIFSKIYVDNYDYFKQTVLPKLEDITPYFLLTVKQNNKIISNRIKVIIASNSLFDKLNELEMRLINGVIYINDLSNTVYELRALNEKAIIMIEDDKFRFDNEKQCKKLLNPKFLKKIRYDSLF